MLGHALCNNNNNNNNNSGIFCSVLTYNQVEKKGKEADKKKSGWEPLWKKVVNLINDKYTKEKSPVEKF